MVSRHLSLSKAAKKCPLHVSMTQQMKNLEDELGVTCLSGKGYSAYGSRQICSKEASDIISKYDNMFSELKVMQNSRW